MILRCDEVIRAAPRQVLLLHRHSVESLKLLLAQRCVACVVCALVDAFGSVVRLILIEVRRKQQQEAPGGPRHNRLLDTPVFVLTCDVFQ
jgi:hypothetical protein